jgi:hypothetical protein
VDLANAIRELWHLKVWVVGVAVLAVLAAIATAYKVQPMPPSLEKKSLEFGAAQAEILIDSPRSALADLGREFTPLAERAQVFSQFMASTPVKDEIARVVGLPPGAVTAEASVASQNLPRSATEPGGGERANELVAEGIGYKLSFEAQESLPIVSVYAQAPKADQAIELADGAAVGLRRYLSRVEAEQQIPDLRRVRVVALGEAKGGIVNSGANKMVAAIAFLGVLTFGCVLLLVLGNVIRGLRSGPHTVSQGIDISSLPDALDIPRLDGRRKPRQANERA